MEKKSKLKMLICRIAILVMLLVASGCGGDFSKPSEKEYIKRFFGSSFSTNLQLHFVYNKGVRGFGTVAEISGAEKDIKDFLVSQGFTAKSAEESIWTLEMVRLRIKSVTGNSANDVWLKSGLQESFIRVSYETSNEQKEFYVSKDYMRLIFIDIKL